jgi:hypothetical protein
MARIALILLSVVMSGCSDAVPIEDDSAVDVRLPGSSLLDASSMTPPMAGDTTMPGFDAGQRPLIDASPNADRYIPPIRPDAGEPTAEEALGLCVDRMTNFISTTAAGLACDQYDEQARSDRSSDFNQIRVVAACIRLRCQGNPIEGHNGIPAARTCNELEDLISVLERAETQALEGGCPEPEFQLRVVSLGEFVGGEPCDQLTCGIGEDGEPITIDNRN